MTPSILAVEIRDELYAIIREPTAAVFSIAMPVGMFAVFASLFGTVVPLVLERMKIDPAIATGPFVTVTNDIVGITIYMAISGWLINLFTNFIG